MKRLYLISGLWMACPAPQGQITEKEYRALKPFYNAAGGNSWKNRTGRENINTTATASHVTGKIRITLADREMAALRSLRSCRPGNLFFIAESPGSRGSTIG